MKCLHRSETVGLNYPRFGKQYICSILSALVIKGFSLNPSLEASEVFQKDLIFLEVRLLMKSRAKCSALCMVLITHVNPARGPKFDSR